MKKITILFVFVLMGLTGCYQHNIPGPEGRDGKDGHDGVDGIDGQEGFVFEYEFSLTAPDYSMLLELPVDFNMLESDVMLVYFLWDVDNGVETWRLLPQTLYYTDGIIHYNYDFTRYDVKVFMDGTIDLDLLGAEYTDNWIARVVVVPAQFTGGRVAIDFSNYDEVLNHFNISSSTSVKVNYQTRPN